MLSDRIFNLDDAMLLSYFPSDLLIYRVRVVVCVYYDLHTYIASLAALSI